MRVALGLWLALALTGCVRDAETDPDATSTPADASAADAPAPDAAVPTPDAARLPDVAAPDPCPEVCARVARCLETECPDLDPAAAAATCEAACAANESFPLVASEIERCPDLVAFAAQNAPALDVGCERDPAFPPPNDACAAYGRRLTECLVERCPAAAEHVDVLSGGHAHECDTAVAEGANPAQFAAWAEAPCDDAGLQGQLDARLEVEDAPYARFCATGPIASPDECAAACEVAAQCLRPDVETNTPFRNPARCEAVCLANGGVPPGWACLAADPRCEAIQTCFSTPPFPACGGYRARLADCFLEACPAFGAVEEGLRNAVARDCEDQVWRGQADGAAVERMASADTCEHEELAAVVERILEAADLGASCEMLRRETEMCETACEHLLPCLNQDGPIREPGVCAFYCAYTADVTDAAWACLEAADGCEQVGSCL